MQESSVSQLEKIAHCGESCCDWTLGRLASDGFSRMRRPDARMSCAMTGMVRRIISRAVEQFAGSGVGVDVEGRICLPDGLDADRVHRFIELCVGRSYESPKAALRDLFQKVGVAPAAVSALGDILGERGDLDLAAIGRSPLKLGATLPRFLEIPARFRTFLVEGLALADPAGSTLEEAVVSARLRAAEHLGCDPCWDAILSRPDEVGELALAWRANAP
jgi:hypothetical protein